jgi:hypothetical protein
VTRPFVISAIGFTAAAVALGLALALDNADEAMQVPQMSSAAMPAEGHSREPGFDVVRIGERGDAVIAGRALPGAEVVISDGGRELGRAMADLRGEWVFVPSGPLAPGARQLTLKARSPDGVVVSGSAPVILVVIDHPSEPSLAIKPLAGGGARLLSGAMGDAGRISIDLLDRDDGNRLFVGGRGQSKGIVHLYADARFLGRVAVDSEGGWRLLTKTPDGAVATVRADLVDDKGKVQARVEIPYEADAEPVAGEGGVAVAPGRSLWRVARRLDGQGAASTVVFEASKDHIRDPAPVRPGQVFLVPKN